MGPALWSVPHFATCFMNLDLGAPVRVDLLSTMNKYSKYSRFPFTKKGRKAPYQLSQSQPLGTPYNLTLQLSERKRKESQGTER